MKNKNEKNSFIKENGFLIALYSVVGILVVVALSLTLIDNKSINEVEKDNSSLSVDNSLTKSYKEQVDNSVVDNSEISFIPETMNENTEKLAEDFSETVNGNKEAVSNEDLAPIEDTSLAIEEESEAPSNDDMALEGEESITVNIDYVDRVTDNTEEKIIEVEEEEEVVNNLDDGESYDDESSSSGYSFSETSKMIWPTLGDIVMTFSSDVLIYDQTLDQYRTNDSISIGADEGSAVLAAADGKVVAIDNDRVKGNNITLDHGNGWMTTYSQLSDDFVVKNGDIVIKGDIIGKVAVPTKYGVNLGTHLDFKVMQNTVPINPLSVLN